MKGWIGLSVALWWLGGPNLVRALGRALWPVRLGWRMAQRWGYRRALRRGVLPAEWPERITPGQRWHDDPEAMQDHRTYRSQTREAEPERRAAMREHRRAERLEGFGLLPDSLWRPSTAKKPPGDTRNERRLR